VIVYSGIVYCDDAKKPKNAPQVFPGFPIIKSARHCGKITIFKKNVRFMGTVSGPAGCITIYIYYIIYDYMYIIYITLSIYIKNMEGLTPFFYYETYGGFDKVPTNCWVCSERWDKSTKTC